MKKHFILPLLNVEETEHTDLHQSSYESFSQSMVSSQVMLGKGYVVQTG